MFVFLATIWSFVIMLFYFLNNSHYLGIGTNEDAGYLFSQNTLHFLVILTITVGGYFYFKNARRSKKKKKKEEKSISITPFVAFLIAFLFVNLNLILIPILRGIGGTPFIEELNLLSAVINFNQKALPLIGYLFLLTLTTFSLGSVVIGLLKIETKDKLLNIIVSITTGLFPLFIVLYAFGVKGVYSQANIIILFVLALIIGWRKNLQIIKDFFTYRISISKNLNYISVILGTIIALILANGFIDLVRPIGVGWDDITRYINYPKLLSDLGVLPNGNYGWPSMVISAMGFTLTKSSEWGHLLLFMTAFWFQGLVVLVFVGIGKVLKLKHSGLLAASMLLTTPMVVHQMIFDTKTDLALTAIFSAALLVLLIWYKKQDNKLLLIVGALIGMTLGIKITAIIGLLIIVLVFVHRQLSISFVPIVGSIVLFLFPFFARSFVEAGLLRDVKFFTVGSGILLLFIGGVLIWRHRPKIDFKSTLVAGSILTISIIVGFAPIAIRNLYQTDYSLDLNKIFIGKTDNAYLAESDLFEEGYSCSKSGFEEEVVRYIGYEESVLKYLKLPWELTMNTQINKPYVDIGFLTLSIIPALVLIYLYKRYREKYEFKDVYKNIIPFAFIFALAVFVWSFVGQGVPWYGITAFALGAILLEYIYSSFEIKLTDKEFLLTALTLALSMFMLYGIVSIKNDGDIQNNLSSFILSALLIVGIFGLPILWIGYKSAFSKQNKFIIFYAILFIGLLIQLGWRGNISSTKILYSYGVGELNEQETIDTTLYAYRYMQCAVNGGVWLRDKFDCAGDEYKDINITRAPVYRIGTFIPFFIKNNDLRVFEDSRMDKVACLLNEYEDQEALERLRSLGFRYLVYDTNSETIEEDPNGPVHQKVANFEAWIKNLANKQEIVICWGSDGKSAVQFISLYPEISSCRISKSEDL